MLFLGFDVRFAECTLQTQVMDQMSMLLTQFAVARWPPLGLMAGWLTGWEMASIGSVLDTDKTPGENNDETVGCCD